VRGRGAANGSGGDSAEALRAARVWLQLAEALDKELNTDGEDEGRGAAKERLRPVREALTTDTATPTPLLLRLRLVAYTARWPNFSRMR